MHKRILPFVTKYHQAVPNLKKIFMSKQHLIQLMAERDMQRYTRSIQTLKAKNTHLRTAGVVLACHNYLISEKNNKTVTSLKKETQQSFLMTYLSAAHCIQVRPFMIFSVMFTFVKFLR